MHTDLDDQRSSVSEPHRQSSNKSNNNSVNNAAAAGHNMPPYEDLTPIYVIKNLVRHSVTHDNLFRYSALLYHVQRFKHNVSRDR